MTEQTPVLSRETRLREMALHVVKTTPPDQQNCWIGMPKADVDLLEQFMQEHRDAGVGFDAEYMARFMGGA